METSDVFTAGFSPSPEPTRWSLQGGRDTEIGAPESGNRARLKVATQHDGVAMSPFNDIACLRCQIKRITVSLPSTQYSRVR